MIFVVLCRYVNCPVDKTIDTGHIASTDCNSSYRIILLMMLFVTFWCKALKTHPSRRYVAMPLE